MKSKAVTNLAEKQQAEWAKQEFATATAKWKESMSRASGMLALTKQMQKIDKTSVIPAAVLATAAEALGDLIENVLEVARAIEGFDL